MNAEQRLADLPRRLAAIYADPELVPDGRLSEAALAEIRKELRAASRDVKGLQLEVLLRSLARAPEEPDCHLW